jgi:hypothetical protein
MAKSQNKGANTGKVAKPKTAVPKVKGSMPSKASKVANTKTGSAKGKGSGGY